MKRPTRANLRPVARPAPHQHRLDAVDLAEIASLRTRIDECDEIARIIISAMHVDEVGRGVASSIENALLAVDRFASVRGEQYDSTVENDGTIDAWGWSDETPEGRCRGARGSRLSRRPTCEHRPNPCTQTPHRVGRRDLAIGVRAHPRHRDCPAYFERQGGRRGHGRARAASNPRRRLAMHEFIIAAAIVAFSVFCLIAALAPIIMVKGENGYEDIDIDHDDR